MSHRRSDYRFLATRRDRPAGRDVRAPAAAFFLDDATDFGEAFGFGRAWVARLPATRCFLPDAAFLTGEAFGFAACRTGLAGTGAGAAFGFTAGAAVAAATGTGLVRGLPPLRANCASANILLNASFASAINCA